MSPGGAETPPAENHCSGVRKRNGVEAGDVPLEKPREWSAGAYAPRELAAREKLPNPKLLGMAMQQWGHLVFRASSLMSLHDI